MNLGAGLPVREFRMAPRHRRVDYLLFVDDRLVGDIEAKEKGHPLIFVEGQSKKSSECLARRRGLSPLADPDGHRQRKEPRRGGGDLPPDQVRRCPHSAFPGQALLGLHHSSRVMNVVATRG